MIRSLVVALSFFAGVAMAEPAIVAVEMAVPGAKTAEQIEAKIAEPIEKVVQTVPGVMGLHTIARPAQVVVEVAFEREPTAADVRAVERAMARARARFKEYTGQPKVTVRQRSPGWDPKP